MTKKEIGKVSSETIKGVVGIATGVATGIVVDTICEAYAPAETAPIIRQVVYKVGTRGLTMVTGALATSAMMEKLDRLESVIFKKKTSEESVVMEVIEEKA